MLYNYIKIAIRNLLRHKAFSFINIAGLAIGLACSILILLWVQDELSFDKFHQQADNTYRIVTTLSETNTWAVSSAPLAPILPSEIPEIKSTLRVHTESALLQVEDRMFDEKRILYADSNFLQFFSFPLVAGDPQTAMQHAASILITEAMAKKYFGSDRALGKIIRKNHKDDLMVTGVLANIPENSHLKFDFIQPMAFLMGDNNWDLKENLWNNFNCYSYVQLNKNYNPLSSALINLEEKITNVRKAHEKKLKIHFKLQPLTQIHLHSHFLAEVPGQGSIQYVYIFSIVAIFILGVACINFMNLATARSARRAKEVGLRKVAGALRFQLVWQFLAESTLISVISVLIALVIVMTILPTFNDLAGKNLTLDLLNATIVIGLIVVTIVTGFMAGSYPALFLSGFVPAKVLKGNLKSGAAGGLFRNTLVIIQFTISIILLIGTGVIYHQMQFIQTRNLGFDKENLVYAGMDGELWSKYTALRSTLEQNSLTRNFSFASDLPTNLNNGTANVQWEGKDPDTQPIFSNLAVDENFMNVFGMTLLSGRNFSKQFSADTLNYMVNERALAIMGMDVSDAIGKSLSFWNVKGTIIGVVKDFNFKPIQEPIGPLILHLNTWGGVAIVRTQPDQVEATTKAMEDIFKKLNPEYPFAYKFIDQDIEYLYKSEQRLERLFTLFASLAIFISCLGLYGLSAFFAERRTKEIGVRKVLGASDLHVVYLLSSTFTKPILVAIVVASPIAWFVMDQWLQGFAYHVAIHWSIFLFASLVSLFIAWITISFESIRAAISNPANSLRDE